ncbi:DUF2577 domain-containing protein [Clostridium botulinum C/D]|uniref:DUF2577 domain-containing protein n=1 Tax=Clostridium botulinum TaxID=1491 RepID=UPI001E591A5F|nr:DUF2577 domain-containing protein [Clostridium botulinum]MCD3211102.1 DUF2577 domain-containing protein [Clostridium botulinum C/D]
MKQDPFVSLIKTMEEAGEKNNPPGIELGNVLSVNPLRIKVGDLLLEKYNLKINIDLLQHSKEVTISNTSITKDKCTVETILKVGDIVAILPTLDKQTYIVLCKVV